MLVTQITELGKGRYHVTMEDGSGFSIYRGEMRKYHIREGEELSEEEYRQFAEEVLLKRARLRCMNLLQSKDYTRRQLEDKLRQGEYPQECIDDAIAYVESYGYLDDERYARSYIEYHMDTRSRIRITTDLMRKGISKEIIQKGFEELEEMGVEQDELTLAQKFLEKKNYSGKDATRQEKSRMYAFLCRKGIRSEVIARALLLDITSN